MKIFSEKVDTAIPSSVYLPVLFIFLLAYINSIARVSLFCTRNLPPPPAH
jgi:hypothetical protein